MRLVTTTTRIPPVVIDAIATYRITRLITADSLTAELRGRVVKAAYASDGRCTEGKGDDLSLTDWAHVPSQDDHPPKLATLITCPWCTSVWCAFGVVAARHLTPRLWDPIARALALSATAGLVAHVAD